MKKLLMIVALVGIVSTSYGKNRIIRGLVSERMEYVSLELNDDAQRENRITMEPRGEYWHVVFAYPVTSLMTVTVIATDGRSESRHKVWNDHYNIREIPTGIRIRDYSIFIIDEVRPEDDSNYIYWDWSWSGYGY